MLNPLDVKGLLVYLFFHLLIHIYTWTPLAQSQHQHVSCEQVKYHVCTITCILDTVADLEIQKGVQPLARKAHLKIFGLPCPLLVM